MILLPLLLLAASPQVEPPSQEMMFFQKDQLESALHSFVDSTLYFTGGTVLGTASLVFGIGWGAFQLTPWAGTLGEECWLASSIFGLGASHAFLQMFKQFPVLSPLLASTPSSYVAWNDHRKSLSKIPAATDDDRKLLQFLERRWLAKQTGCYTFLVEWMCPSFGITMQMHPETTNSYARLPSDKVSDTYKKRVEAWKYFLPQPREFPLVLTRPASFQEYFPYWTEIPDEREIPFSMRQIATMEKTIQAPMVIDLTSVLPIDTLNRTQWLEIWERYEKEIVTWCKEHALDIEQIICIQRVQQKDLGGIRLLPFASTSQIQLDKHYQFLLERLSRFGLAANRIELDRSSLQQEKTPAKLSHEPITTQALEKKEKWSSLIRSIESKWNSNHLQKTMMVQGTLQILKDLCSSISQEKWEEIAHSSTRAAAAQLSFSRIHEKFQQILEKEKTSTFLPIAMQLEQIHADISSLLEIFSPFALEDFPCIFEQHLASLPQELRPLTRYSLHTAGMTSLAGIFKSVEKMAGRRPRLLYGENTYFECIFAAERVTEAKQITEASEKDWKEADLILVQFNPALKRINFVIEEYHVEKIAENLRTALKLREGKPLAVALDCTLDYSDSSRVSRLLAEFRKEIAEGTLAFFCFRSGTKYDIFGMDNYCGAPFFMVRNDAECWTSFDDLLSDPVLQTDRLSANWFCLAFQRAAPYLEAYRQQIFDNTRAVLDRVPKRLYSNTGLPFRVVPMDPDIDPSFIDIKVYGPCHEFRGGLLVGVLFTVKCMQAGHPLFYRPSLGFYHPNLAVLFGEDCTTIRLTVGIDPTQVDVMAQCMAMLDKLNGQKRKKIHRRH